MIRINKGKVPATVPDKCQEITNDFRKIFGELVRMYEAKQGKGKPIALDDKDYARLTEVLVGGGASKKAVKAARSRLKPIVFSEEVIEETVEVGLDEAKLKTLRPKWNEKMEPLLKAYNEIVKGVHENWKKALGDLATRVDVQKTFVVARKSYQEKVLATGRPFLTSMEASRPRWFTPDELAGWTSPSDDVPPPVVVGVFAAWQRLIDFLADECREHTLHKLLPTLWMLGSLPTSPPQDTLFAYAVAVYKLRLERRLPLELSLTGDEIVEAAKVIPSFKDELAWGFLSVRALGEALDDAMAPARKPVARPLIGFASDAFSSDYYAGHGIKEALMTTHFGKCAFCEAKVRHIAHGDVEHFRPKAGYEQGHTFNRSGYFWEAYHWRNLYYSCQTCNQVYKGNRFPVLLDDKGIEVRMTYDRRNGVDKERPILIEPGEEDPRLCIRFNPINGEAYPFDLVSAYGKHKGAGDVERDIWNDPKLIPPFVSDFKLTVDAKTQKFAVSGTGHELWTKLHELPPAALRGVRTIQLLGLNRRELLRQRVAHLRSLRGLYWAAFQKNAECEAAQEALKQARQPDAEFSSLAIDAFCTWERERSKVDASVSMGAPNPFSLTTNVDPWIARYNKLLSEPIEYEEEEGIDFTDSDAIMYLVTPELAKSGEDRQLVYMTKDEDFDEDNPPGWYLGVPEDDYSLKVGVFTARGKQIETLTIEDLLKASQPWRKFKNNRLFVKGPFQQRFKI